VNHGVVANACRNGAVMSKFPKGIQDFGNLFVAAQEKRHRADYDPGERFVRSETLEDVEAADEAISAFKAEPLRDRRAFAAWVCFENRDGQKRKARRQG
jgi:hypothetical protein